jgi:hypothetical protein
MDESGLPRRAIPSCHGLEDGAIGRLPRQPQAVRQISTAKACLRRLSLKAHSVNKFQARGRPKFWLPVSEWVSMVECKIIFISLLLHLVRVS